MEQPIVGRRTFVKGGLAASALAALAACGKKETSAGTGSDGVSTGGTITYYLNNPVSIDPYNAQEDQGMQVCFQLFDSLTFYDFESEKLVGQAAESWEANEAADQFTFHLVKDAKFHNGDAVDAASFKRGWERICNPATSDTPSLISYHLSLVEGYQDMLDGKATELSGLTCPDESTLVVKLTAPYADFPYVVSHPALAPVPAVALDDFKAFFLAPIGNGPFKMDGQWKDGVEINVVRFDDYYGGKANLDGVHFNIQKDVETAFREFQAGNIDMCEIPAGQIKNVIEQYGESEDGFTVTPGKQAILGAELSTYYLVINMADGTMADLNLRKAISLGINRQAICDTCFEGSAATPADNIVSPGIKGYEEGAWEFAKYDKDAALKLLDEAYPADAEGKRGIKLTLSYNLDGSHKQIMEMVQADLTALGIEIEPKTGEWATVLQDYSAGNFQFGRLGWIADYPILDNLLYPLFYTGNGDNRGKYSNEAVDKGIDAARALTDDDQRVAALQEVNRTVAADVPVVPIFFYTHKQVGSGKVKKLYMNPMKLVDMHTAEANA